MLVVSDVRGDCQINLFCSMTCYVLTMNNFGKVCEGYNKVVDWMLPTFQSIKEMSIAFTINKMLEFFVGNVDGFKRSDAVGTRIQCGSVYDMALNMSPNVFSSITRGVWGLRR